MLGSGKFGGLGFAKGLILPWLCCRSCMAFVSLPYKATMFAIGRDVASHHLMPKGRLLAACLRTLSF